MYACNFNIVSLVKSTCFSTNPVFVCLAPLVPPCAGSDPPSTLLMLYLSQNAAQSSEASAPPWSLVMQSGGPKKRIQEEMAAQA